MPHTMTNLETTRTEIAEQCRDIQLALATAETAGEVQFAVNSLVALTYLCGEWRAELLRGGRTRHA